MGGRERQALKGRRGPSHAMRHYAGSAPPGGRRRYLGRVGGSGGWGRQCVFREGDAHLFAREQLGDVFSVRGEIQLVRDEAALQVVLCLGRVAQREDLAQLAHRPDDDEVYRLERLPLEVTRHDVGHVQHQILPDAAPHRAQRNLRAAAAETSSLGFLVPTRTFAA
eukprot:1190504-Prorocentrum_minimum.AAC.3